MDLKRLISKMDELSTAEIVVETTPEVITESVVVEETSTSGIAQQLLKEFNYTDWRQSDIDAANKARDLAVGFRPGQQPPESWATAKGPAQIKPAPKLANLPPEKGPTAPTQPTAATKPTTAQSGQPADGAPNPYPPGSPSAEIFDKLSPEDQAWAIKGGGRPDLTDEFIRNRMPNKGQPVEKQGTQQSGQPAAQETPPTTAQPSQQAQPAAGAKPAGSKYTFDPKVQEVQKKLIALGVDVGPTGADGKLGPNTAGGIKAFEKMAGLPETGKLSPELEAALAKGKAVEKGSDLGQSLSAIERIALKYKVENIFLIAADGTVLTEDAIDDIKGYATAGAAGGIASKLLSKSGKALPGVGTGLSAYDALERWKDGDRSGAVIAALAGIGWLIPGLGLVLGGGLDAYNMTRDKELTGSYFGGDENRALARKVDKALGFTTESVSESQRIADLRDQLMQLENTEAVLSEGPLSALKAVLSGGTKLAKGAAYGVKNPAAASTLKSVPGASKMQKATTGAARAGSAVMRNPTKAAAVGGVAAGAAGMSAMSGSPATKTATDQSAQPGGDQAAASAQEIEQAVDQAEEQGIVIDPKDLEFLNTHLAVIKKYVDDPQLELPKDIQDRLLALTPKIQKLQAIAAAQAAPKTDTEPGAETEPGDEKEPTSDELAALKKTAGVSQSAQPAQPAKKVTVKSPAVDKFKAVLANPELLKQFTPEEVAKLKELTDQIDTVQQSAGSYPTAKPAK